MQKRIDRHAIRRKMKMKADIGRISDPTFTPEPSANYRLLGEPYASQAMAQFELRKASRQAYREQLKESILKNGYDATVASMVNFE